MQQVWKVSSPFIPPQPPATIPSPTIPQSQGRRCSGQSPRAREHTRLAKCGAEVRGAQRLPGLEAGDHTPSAGVPSLVAPSAPAAGSPACPSSAGHQACPGGLPPWRSALLPSILTFADVEILGLETTCALIGCRRAGSEVTAALAIPRQGELQSRWCQVSRFPPPPQGSRAPLADPGAAFFCKETAGSWMGAREGAGSGREWAGPEGRGWPAGQGEGLGGAGHSRWPPGLGSCSSLLLTPSATLPLLLLATICWTLSPGSPTGPKEHTFCKVPLNNH